MNLREIRESFVRHSGRFDLVKDRENWKDDGANFFINAGQRFLDQLMDNPKTKAVHRDTLKAGQSELRVPLLRSTNKVMVIVDGENSFLDRIYYQDFRESYGESTDNGVPKYYALIELRDANRPNKGALRHKGILIAPPPNDDYEIVVRGKFFSHELKDDQSYSYWSMEYPETLIQASMYELEKFYRNTQGMNDHLNAIMATVNNIDNDVVEEDAEQRATMNDSFNERS